MTTSTKQLALSTKYLKMSCLKKNLICLKLHMSKMLQALSKYRSENRKLQTLSKHWSENRQIQTVPKRSHQQGKNSNRYQPKHKHAGDRFTLEPILTMKKKLHVVNAVSRCWRITFRDIWQTNVAAHAWMPSQLTKSFSISMRRLNDSLELSFISRGNFIRSC